MTIEELRQIAQDVYDSANTLNEAIEKAGRANLKVDLKVIDVGTMDNPDQQFISAKVCCIMRDEKL